MMGVCINSTDGMETETHRFTMHYGKKECILCQQGRWKHEPERDRKTELGEAYSCDHD